MLCFLCCVMSCFVFMLCVYIMFSYFYCLFLCFHSMFLFYVFFSCLFHPPWPVQKGRRVAILGPHILLCPRFVYISVLPHPSAGLENPALFRWSPISIIVFLIFVLLLLIVACFVLFPITVIHFLFHFCRTSWYSTARVLTSVSCRAPVGETKLGEVGIWITSAPFVGLQFRCGTCPENPGGTC
jgi:hypothetical protein